MRFSWLAAGFVASVALAQTETYVVNSLPSSLEGQWWFRLGHDPAWSSPFREKTHWQLIHVPGPWERQGHPGYNGHAWYRVTFQLSNRLVTESLGVDLGTLGDVDEVFLNGQRIGGAGSLPPTYEPATLQRRIYRLPRSALRFGDRNELTVHVYNPWRFGGFLGPSPVIDRYERLLAHQTGRDIVIWVVTAVLAVLVVFHGLMWLFSGGGKEQWSWVGFLLTFGLYQIPYATFGPSLFFSPGFNFRLSVAFLLLSVGLFPIVFGAILGESVPVLGSVFLSIMGLGAGFALLWRQVSDLYLWVYAAEASIVVIIALALWLLLRGKRGRTALPWFLIVSTVLFFVAVLADVAVDLCLLPRPSSGPLVLYSSLAVLPFAFSLSYTFATRWTQQHAASLLPHLGLLPWFTFTREIRQRLGVSPPPSFALALMRFSTAAGTPVKVEEVVAELRRHMRHCDLLARYSGDTIAILLEGHGESDGVAHIERVRRTLRQIPGRLLLRPAVGLAAFTPGRYTSAEELVQAAEAALYAARAEGGDCTATAP